MAMAQILWRFSLPASQKNTLFTGRCVTEMAVEQMFDRQESVQCAGWQVGTVTTCGVVKGSSGAATKAWH